MIHSASQSAIRVIQREHACLSAVILGMLHFVREIESGRKAPDLKVFRAMLLYISEYPEKIHHPKEDNFLFARLKQRTGKAAEVLAFLEADHAEGDKRVRALEHALTRYELTGNEEFENFRINVEEYARDYLRHMRAEEDDVLPLAMEFLNEDDWKAVNEAFASNRDPLAGGLYKESFDKLFSLITTITPAPVGLGPETAR